MKKNIEMKWIIKKLKDMWFNILVLFIGFTGLAYIGNCVADRLAKSDFKVGSCYDKLTDEANPFEVESPGTIICMIAYKDSYYQYQRYSYDEKNQTYREASVDNINVSYLTGGFYNLSALRIAKRPIPGKIVRTRKEMRISSEKTEGE